MSQSWPKKFNIEQVEEKWQREWEDKDIYHFNWEDESRPVFTIDTPPPYPSGEFHMGNVLNWTYFDMLARYKRMRGYNVLFPQGWDCHGLSIEVEVERTHNVRKRDVPPEKFREWCKETIEKYIAMMKDSIIRLGCSVDWSTEYRTMNPDYWQLTQLSFIRSFHEDLMYQGTHPVNWCPRCETAIADAEVNYHQKQGTLHYLKFPLVEKEQQLLIATTRPELLPACVAVAVHPGDARYTQHIGQKIEVPLTDRTVKVIADDMVDPSFGTGVVMICTYGDKADVKTVLKNDLPVISLLTEDGRITEEGGKYAGLPTSKAKESMVADLKSSELLEKTESLQQEVGVCERCDTPIEILERKQWFMKNRQFTDKVLEAADEVKWYPEYMKARLTDWADSLDWDWVISRQRVFGTPIPIWYCKHCGEKIVAEEDWVPIDPKLEDPQLDECPKCGSTEFLPEKDVFDTWMDSSLTCAVHAGWPHKSDWETRFPADVHPSGIDIIRTWAYYLMVRHLALFNQKPFKSCLINGMVLGEDGRKMSKSLKNYTATSEVLEKYGADAARQWAASGGATGSDIPFRWPDVKYGWRFLVKLWNASRFVNGHLEDFTPQDVTHYNLQILDRWILSKAEKMTKQVTEALEECQFNIALEKIRNFTWHVFCDLYLEGVKDRLYNPEKYGEDQREAAQYALYTVLYRVMQLLAPVTPHITEEIYQKMFSAHAEHPSIHLSPWPTPTEDRINQEAIDNGDLIMAVISEVRREKSEKHLSLNTEVKKLTIYTSEEEKAETIRKGKEDIIGTCKVSNLEILSEEGKGRTLELYDDIRLTTQY